MRAYTDPLSVGGRSRPCHHYLAFERKTISAFETPTGRASPRLSDCLGQQFQQGANFAPWEPRGGLSAAVQPDTVEARRRRAFCIQQAVVTDVQGVARTGTDPAHPLKIDRRVRL